VTGAEAAARKRGISAVPCVEIDHEMVTGAQPVEVFMQAIQRATAH